MSPTILFRHLRQDGANNKDLLAPRQVMGSEPPTKHEAMVLEGWAEGFMIGGLVVMAAITIANMRRGVLLHKLILLELCIGGWQAFNLFWEQPTYGWWLSSATIGLHVSSQIHSLVAWMKIKPFLSRRSSQVFIGTVLLVQPYWIMEIYATFTYFNNVNTWLFPRTRPIEVLFRDPWWVAACGKLLWVIKDHYDISLRNVVIINPRFGVLLAAMFLSIVFVLMDILSVTQVFKNVPTVGVNPFWKLALVFKCLTDTVILEDFKTALDRMWTYRRESLGIASPLVNSSSSSSRRGRRRRRMRRERGQPTSSPVLSSNGKPNPAVNAVSSSSNRGECYYYCAEHSSSLQSSSRDHRSQLEVQEEWEQFEMRPPAATAQRSI